MEPAKSVCPRCKLPILAEFYFCPNCGKQLRVKPITVSLKKQVGIYLLSFFLTPFGLIFAFKYIKQPNRKTKIIGWVALVLTIISYSITFTLAQNVIQIYIQMLTQLSSGQVPTY